MSTPTVQAADHLEKLRTLRRVRAYAEFLDHSITLPIINYKIGINPIIGLIPGIGDAAGLVLSSYIVLEAVRLKTPAPVLARMVRNVVIEAVVGTLPLIGDLFDATFKANMRNLKLLEQAHGQARTSVLT